MMTLDPDHEDVVSRAARILQVMDDTPIPAMDATFYAHYIEELRMIVEEVSAHDTPCQPPTDRVWLIWSCDDIVGTYRTEHDAQEARADLQHQLLCQYGPDVELLESITISTAHVQTALPALARGLQ